MLKVDQMLIIRHKVLNEERPIRETARDMCVSRNTVRKYVRAAPERPRKKIQRRSPKVEEVGPRIDEILKEWSTRTTKKQRVTGSRVHAELVTEGYDVGVTTVRTYLRRKRQAEAEVMIPLVHRPGDEGQVDFFAVTVDVAGKRREAHMFTMSLPYSDKDFAWIYAWEDLAAILDGHVRAFERFGGVPRRMIYDNPKLVVNRIEGGERVLNEHFKYLIAHFAFEPCFARVGEGHDKGGVEVRGKRVRLQNLVPIPAGDTFEEINGALLESLDALSARRKNVEGRTVAERFAEEQQHFLPLPGVAFDPRLPTRVQVRKDSTVRLGGASYSLPSEWTLGSAMAWVGGQDVRFEQDGRQLILERQRRGGKRISYLHYLPQLARRPQAVRQVAPELLSELGEPWQQLWCLLVDAHEERRAGPIMAGFLEAVVRSDLKTVTTALETVLSVQAMSSVGIGTDTTCAPVVRLTALPEALVVYEVQAGCASDYDHLLLGEPK